MINEKRSHAAAELRVASEGDKPKTLSGYAAVFNSASRALPVPGVKGKTFIEKIRPGAFANALKNGADVRALVNHNPDLILGRSTAGTLRLSEDEKGLRFEVDLSDTACARDAATAVARGDMSGCSFGFRTLKDEWSMVDGQAVRELIEVEPFDIGPVTFPAYDATEADVRSLTPEARAIIEVDDRSLQYYCRYAIEHLRRTHDGCQSVMEVAGNIEGTLTEADLAAIDDCSRQATATVEKINKLIAALATVSPAAAADDEGRSAEPSHLARAQRLLKQAMAE